MGCAGLGLDWAVLSDRGRCCGAFGLPVKRDDAGSSGVGQAERLYTSLKCRSFSILLTSDCMDFHGWLL